MWQWYYYIISDIAIFDISGEALTLNHNLKENAISFHAPLVVNAVFEYNEVNHIKERFPIRILKLVFV